MIIIARHQPTSLTNQMTQPHVARFARQNPLRSPKPTPLAKTHSARQNPRRGHGGTWVPPTRQLENIPNLNNHILFSISCLVPIV